MSWPGDVTSTENNSQNQATQRNESSGRARYPYNLMQGYVSSNNLYGTSTPILLEEAFVSSGNLYGGSTPILLKEGFI